MTTLLDHHIGPVGYGLMGLTRPVDPCPQKQCFAAMNMALECGSNYWNGGEFYGTPERNTMHLLNEYFTKYPEKASQIILCIKGGRTPGSLEFDGREASIRRSVDEVLRVLDGKKSLDIFECARVPPNVPVEETIETLVNCVREGKFKGIGLSEVNADTIRRAAKVHPIAQVEVELSLWTTNILRNGVAQTCAELGIPIIAYAPLSRGALTNSVARKKADELPVHLKAFPRFQEANLQRNLALTAEVEKIANKKGCSTPQVALAWVRQQSGRNGQGLILPIPGAEREEWVMENTKAITLTEEEMQELDDIVNRHHIEGMRYGGEIEKLNEA